MKIPCQIILLLYAVSFSLLANSQNYIEVQLSKVSSFSTYGKDSLHVMIAKTDLLPPKEIYEPNDLRFVIDKKGRKVFRFKHNQPFDTLPIKKIAFTDSIYTITVIEKRDEMYAHYEGQMIDCYLVVDIRKNPRIKKHPTFCYWWCWDIFINDEPMDLCRGKLSDYVTIDCRNTFEPKKKPVNQSSSVSIYKTD